MGQEVGGLMFGVRVDDAAIYGFRDEWKGVCLDARERYAQRFQAHDRYIRADYRFIPTNDATGEAIGFFVAIVIHGRDYFCLTPEHPMTASMLRKTKSYRRARRAWHRFASWVENTKGHRLPKAEILLVRVEVG